MIVMNLRNLASIVAAASLAVACNSEDKPKGKPKSPTAPAGSTAAQSGSAKPDTSGTTKPAGDNGGKKGNGVIKGTVSFSGDVPKMGVPKARAKADVCKDSEVSYNAVVVADGKLKDVLVSIAPDQLEGHSASGDVVIDQKACMYSPRIAGAMPEQKILISNSDPTLHNVNASLGAETLFNSPQAKGAAQLTKSFEEIGVHRLKCDVHSWMRAFIVVTDNPFYAATGADGTYTIKGVPDGTWKLEAWHSQYGKKTGTATVKGGAVTTDFSYSASDPEPEENKGELNDLF